MTLAYITLALLAVTLVSYVVGTIWLAKYAFRLGVGPGLGVLLFPPYTFYFAFYQLDVDAKDRPTALWMFGLVASVLIILIFGQPLISALTGGGLDALAAKPIDAPQREEIVATPTPAVETPPVETPPAIVEPAPTLGADADALAPAVGGDAVVTPPVDTPPIDAPPIDAPPIDAP